MPSLYDADASPLATKLEGQLSRLEFPLSPATRAAVRECVCEYVDSAKAQGWPPERIIVEIKHIAAHVGFRSVLATAPRRRSSDLLLGDMVGWCIRRYYARDERCTR
jgi:hypothetical protein